MFIKSIIVITNCIYRNQEKKYYPCEMKLKMQFFFDIGKFFENVFRKGQTYSKTYLTEILDIIL